MLSDLIVLVSSGLVESSEDNNNNKMIKINAISHILEEENVYRVFNSSLLSHINIITAILSNNNNSTNHHLIISYEGSSIITFYFSYDLLFLIFFQ